MYKNNSYQFTCTNIFKYKRSIKNSKTRNFVKKLANKEDKFWRKYWIRKYLV